MSGPRPSSAPHPSTDPQASTQGPPPALIEHALHARIDAFSPACPSARTSYTRVDFTGGTGANTPRPAIMTGVEDGEEPQPDDDLHAQVEDVIPQTSQVSLTFLLVSGRRRTMSFEPETTIGRVKELVWNAWPNGEQSCLRMSRLHARALSAPAGLASRTTWVVSPLTHDILILWYRLAGRASSSTVISKDTVPWQDSARRGSP